MYHDLSLMNDKIRTLEQYSKKKQRWNKWDSGYPDRKRHETRDGRGDRYRDRCCPQSFVVQQQANSSPHRRASRDIWLNKYRENPELTAHQINDSFPKHNVNVNEHPSPDNMVFLAKLKVNCKDVGYGICVV